jgi:type IV secretory pathway VirJ component
MDFCPSLKIRTPLCKGDDLRTAVHASSGSIDLLPLTRAHTRWVVQAAQAGQACDARLTRGFLARLPASNLITVRNEVPAASPEALTKQVLEAVGQLQAKPAGSTSSAAEALTDLPLVEVPATVKASDTFAILLSGDGGWTGLDKDVAAALAARGVAVVGWDSLRYFWKARTPEGLAADAKRIIDHYAHEWQKSHVLLLGYSQGANVLPFLANRLPETTRKQVSLIAMTGLGASADFEFHFANWAGSSQQALPVLPEAARLSGPLAICIYGRKDEESACPQLDPKHVQSIPLPGGHHFDGNYGAVADVILQAAKVN